MAKIVDVGLALFSFLVAFFFFLLTGASLTERTRSRAVKRSGALCLVAALGLGTTAFSVAPRPAVAQTAQFTQTAQFAQAAQVAQAGGARGTGETGKASETGRTGEIGGFGGTGETNGLPAAPRRFDPLRRDALGVQTRYPAVAKIVGRDAPQAKEDGSQTIPLYYGTGTLVAEIGEWGIVLSNWHVVSEARDSIVVKFPTFSSPARVILRDEVWDLAALLVRKPPRVAPIPISQEVPGVGDALWVAGYGKSAGLTEFQIQGGRVQNYALLVTTDDEAKESSTAESANGTGNGNASGKPGAIFAQDGRFGQNKRGSANGGAGASTLTATPDDAFYYETLAVDKGVREGDSGGPIFNRYGELAGVLWGSNGESTMGTYCIRAQFFLTQAIGRLATLEATRRLERPNAPSDELLTWRAEDGVPDAEGSDVWARTALEASGVHPIAQRPAYVAADGRETPENLLRLDVDAALKRVRTALTVAENATTTALPPSPPVFSPTFVSQQRLQNCVRPEVAEADFWTTLTEAELTKLTADRALATTQVRETSVIDQSDARLTYVSGRASTGGGARNDVAMARALRPRKPEQSAQARGGEASSLARKEESDEPPARWSPLDFGGQGGEGGRLRENSKNDRYREDDRDRESFASDADASSGSGEDGEIVANVEPKETEKTENGGKREDAGIKENGQAGKASKSGENNKVGKNGKIGESGKIGKTGENAGAAEGDDAESGKTSTAPETTKRKNKEQRVKFNGVYLNDIQVYLIVCMIFCLFYNAARLMTEADAKQEGQKRQKTRCDKEFD